VRKAKLEENTDLQPLLELAATYSPNRRYLYDFLQQPRQIYEEPLLPEEPTTETSTTQNIVETAPEIAAEMPKTTEEILVKADEPMPQISESLEDIDIDIEKNQNTDTTNNEVLSSEVLDTEVFIGENPDNEVLDNEVFVGENPDNEVFVGENLDNEVFVGENPDNENLDNEVFVGENLNDENLDNEVFVGENLDNENFDNEVFVGENLNNENLDNEVFVGENLDNQNFDNEVFVSENLDNEALDNEVFVGENLNDEVLNDEVLDNEVLDNEVFVGENLNNEKSESETIERNGADSPIIDNFGTIGSEEDLPEQGEVAPTTERNDTEESAEPIIEVVVATKQADSESPQNNSVALENSESINNSHDTVEEDREESQDSYLDEESNLLDDIITEQAVRDDETFVEQPAFIIETQNTQKSEEPSLSVNHSEILANKETQEAEQNQRHLSLTEIANEDTDNSSPSEKARSEIARNDAMQPEIELIKNNYQESEENEQNSSDADDDNNNNDDDDNTDDNTDDASASFADWLGFLNGEPAAIELPIAKTRIYDLDEDENESLEDSDAEEDVRRLARESVAESPAIISETLAKLLEMQKKYDKAIIMYKQLITKYPEKSATFAAQIDKIKNKK
jgi:uncharacterized protein YjbI with pentapeptide repeats